MTDDDELSLILGDKPSLLDILQDIIFVPLSDFGISIDNTVNIYYQSKIFGKYTCYRNIDGVKVHLVHMSTPICVDRLCSVEKLRMIIGEYIIEHFEELHDR